MLELEILVEQPLGCCEMILRSVGQEDIISILLPNRLAILVDLLALPPNLHSCTTKYRPNSAAKQPAHAQVDSPQDLPKFLRSHGRTDSFQRPVDVRASLGAVGGTARVQRGAVTPRLPRAHPTLP